MITYNEFCHFMQKYERNKQKKESKQQKPKENKLAYKRVFIKGKRNGF